MRCLVRLLVTLFLIGGLGFFAWKTFTGSDEADLYQYKTANVGDNSNVIALLNKLVDPNLLSVKDIEIKADAKPYTLTVNVEQKDDVKTDDFFNYAAVTLSLISNLDTVTFVDATSGQTLAQFDRQQAESQLQDVKNRTLDSLSQSTKSLEDFVNQFR